MAGLRGKYEVGARLGGGGMAEVFHGKIRGAEGFSRPVAIKRIQPSMSATPSFAKMFVNEARLAALLHHPNVVAVLDFDRDEEGSFFLVMELVQGVDLHELVDLGPIPFHIAAFIVAEVLEGLAYAHELEHEGKHLRIVHRDVSPHNVMLSWDGNVKLVDFGIAKAVAATGATRSGALKGKIGYMSPEQAHGQALDGRSDVFAVGIMFHELLTGTRLFKGGTEPEILARLLTAPIPAPREVRSDVPADLSHVCMRMLARDRDQRCGSARAALEELLHCGSMSARASLDLEALMAQRFPQRAPKQRVSAPRGAQPAPVAVPPVGGPDAGPVSRQAVPQRTYTAGSAATPTARGEQLDVDEDHGTPTWMWIAMALTVSAVAIGGAIYISGGTKKKSAAGSTAMIDAAASSAAIIDAAASRAASPVDAGAAVAVQQPDARPSTVDRPPTRRPSTSRRSSRHDEKREPGRLSVYVDPWAKVYVNGKLLKQTPITNHSLRPGRYRITLAYPGGAKRETVRVTIRSGRGSKIRRDWSGSSP